MEAVKIIEERKVAPFNSIKLKGIGNVYITQGEEQLVNVSSDKDITSKIKTEVINNELIISLSDILPLWIVNAPKIDIDITMKDIRAFKVSGIGRIKCENRLKTDSLIITNSGLGSISLDIESNAIKTRLSGVGNVELKGITTNHEVTISGTGKVQSFYLETKCTVVNSTGVGECLVNSSDQLEVKISGAGKVKYKGDPKVRSKLSGLGSLEPVD